MPDKIARIAQTFLNEVTVQGGKEAFEIMNVLIEELENKPDPDPIEVRLVSNLHSFVTVFEALKLNLRSYVINSSDRTGVKLQSLYENNSHDGGYGNLKD